MLAFCVAAGVGSAQSAYADEREDLEQLRATTMSLIQALVESGVLPRERASELIQKAESSVKAQKPGERGEKKVVRVQYVPDSVKNEIREQIKQEVLAQAKTERWGEPNALPDWIDRIQWEGELRLRYQGDRFGDDNASALFYPFAVPGTTQFGYGPDLSNTTEDRDRFTVRARLGMLAKLDDGLGAGFRITTGNSNGPVSTSQTLGGGNASFNKYDIFLDRAYLRWQPVDWFMASGGRIPNPWFSTDLVWSDDLNFDGAAATFKPMFGPRFSAFLTGGAFAVQEFNSDDRDKFLFGAQAGFEWSIDTRTSLKFGAAVYHYQNIEGEAEPPGSFGGVNYANSEYSSDARSKGNTIFDISDPTNPDVILGLASKFRPVALTGVLDLGQFDPVHIILSGEYVINTAFDAAEIRRRSTINQTLPKENEGYQTRLTVGNPSVKEKGDWQLFGGYRYLERDAILDAFADANFNLGGTNYKGFFIGGQYAVFKNTALAFRWMSTDEISGAPLAVDTLQVDLNARF